MNKVTSSIFGCGQVEYVAPTESVPPSTEVAGIVTIKNCGRAGIPGHFRVSFSVFSEVSEGPIRGTQSFILTVVVPNENPVSSYWEVQANAASQIAPMLRSMADQIELQVNDAEA